MSVEDVVSAGGDGSIYSGEADGNDAEETVNEVEAVEGVRGLADDGLPLDSDDLLVDQMTHLVINVDVMEEHGLEAAEKEARSRDRRMGGRRKG